MPKAVVIVIDLHCLFTEDVLTALDSVAGRKHPNTVQAKQLKSSLPLVHIFLHLVTSQVNFVFISSTYLIPSAKYETLPP